MSNPAYQDLPWLRRQPADVAAQCRSLAARGADMAAGIREVASYALDDLNLRRLAKIIRGAQAEHRSLAPLIPFRLGVLSNANADFLTPALVATAARHAIALECVESDYGQVASEALSPGSRINSTNLDAVLIAIDYRALPLKPCPGDSAEAERVISQAFDYLNALRAGIGAHGKAIPIIQTIAPPAERLFGSLDRSLPGTMRHLIDGVNSRISEAFSNGGALLFDAAGLAESVGLAQWHDPAQWNLAKIPFNNNFVPLYADRLCSLLAAMRGKSRRCLILDLDNTLWSGVIGDDGIEGIVIAQGDATGEAHLSLQRAALDLRARGVVLAVSSKNSDDIARLPFRQHPEMLLREDHFAVFQANWNDKATNIRAIAEELSLGLDAMVFVDDNPVERDFVRQALPEIAVPELPPDPALYARTLLAAGYFEAVTFSPEDRIRAEAYQDNARRVTLQKQSTNLDTYLASLDMDMIVQPFDSAGRARIAQLIQKSNQFNLTTRRYTEADIKDIATSPDCFAIQVRLTDIFGDNGMISVIICRKHADAWDIDTWLMSCRVLGRKVENAVLQEIVSAAHVAGIKKITGAYIPTKRNALVEDHYAKLGFALVERCADGTTRWSLDVEAAPREELPIAVRHVSGAAAGPMRASVLQPEFSADAKA